MSRITPIALFLALAAGLLAGGVVGGWLAFLAVLLVVGVIGFLAPFWR